MNQKKTENKCEKSVGGQHIARRVKDTSTYFVYACDSCGKTEFVDRYPSKERHE